MRKIALFAAAALAACSTGQLGSKGNVRFSQVVSFVETTDFGPPIVTGAGMLIQLEYPSDTPEIVNPQLDLVVADGTGTSASSHAEVVPLGFAQYAVTLSQGGNYTLIANEGGTQLDTLGVAAASANAIRFHPQATVIATTASGTGSSATACVQSSSVDVSSLTLSPNTTITLDVVPTDANGNAMLGMLNLTATATGAPVQLQGGFLGQGLEPNAVSIVPDGTLGTPLTVTVSDAVTGKSVSATIQTQTANAPCSG